jgi:hypothetical protein
MSTTYTFKPVKPGFAYEIEGGTGNLVYVISLDAVPGLAWVRTVDGKRPVTTDKLVAA